MKTLTRMAVGIAVAKGVQYATNGTRKTTTTVKAATRRTTTRSYVPDDSGMGGIMDEIMGAGKSTARSKTRSSVDVLLGKSTTTRSRKTAPKGGLEDMIGDMLGGGSKPKSSGAASSGGLGDLFGAILGGASAAAPRMPAPEQTDEAEAAILLRAMIQAAKADGTLDADEKAHLMQAAGDASPEEIAFINHELATPVDIDGLLACVPRGLEEKVYMVSVMAITLDQRAEAEYLHALATALGLTPDDVNGIHDHLKAPRIY